MTAFFVLLHTSKMRAYEIINANYHIAIEDVAAIIAKNPPHARLKAEITKAAFIARIETNQALIEELRWVLKNLPEM